MKELGAYEVRKSLALSDFVIAEFPGLLMKFLPGGILNILGDNPKSPLRHYWSIIHNGHDCILSIAPHILNTPSDMKVDMMGNHITLTSLVDPNEVLHLTRLKLKAEKYS